MNAHHHCGEPSPSLMVVAGEVSGDIHAANLLRALLRRQPGLHAFGVGGDQLQDAGLHCLHRSEELSHMGLVEVLRELPRIRRVMADLLVAAERRRPSLAVLVDSPDFNLRLAKQLHRRGIDVLLFISPQLWAWRRGRVRTVRRVAREVLCILPFEVDFYREAGVRARYVGHPLVDELHRSDLLDERPATRPKQLALLPGSRAMEVKSLLPTMIEALSSLPGSLVDDAVLIEAPGMSGIIDEVLATVAPPPRLRRVRGDGRRSVLAASALAWAASGTATLECALLDVPMIVGYRLHRLSYLLAQLLVHVPHVSLVNLIAEGPVVPELLQSAWRPDRLVGASRQLLEDDRGSQRSGLAEVRRRLGSAGASERAAACVLEYLESARCST